MVKLWNQIVQDYMCNKLKKQIYNDVLTISNCLSKTIFN